jgi:hypothetical protein
LPVCGLLYPQLFGTVRFTLTLYTGERLSRHPKKLDRAKAQGRVGGRPRIRREKDKDAKTIRQLREDGQSYQEIADELGRSKAGIARVCQTLGCSPTAQSERMPV